MRCETSLFVLLSLAAAFADDVGSEGSRQELIPSDDFFEEYASAEEILRGSDHSHLRRDLQSASLPAFSCFPLSDPQAVWICGSPGSRGSGGCDKNEDSCYKLSRYPCTCSNGSSTFQTTCVYCRTHMSNGVMCQKTGSSSVFTSLKGELMKCSCNDFGNQSTQQVCNEVIHQVDRNPDPFAPPLPVVPTPVQPPVVPPAPVQPPVTPPVDDRTQPVPPPTTPLYTCLPKSDPQSVWVCGSAGSRGIAKSNKSGKTCSKTCDDLEPYLCNCNSGGRLFESMCSYCRTEMSNGVACMKTGSSSVFSGQNGGLEKCSCNDNGLGIAQLKCTPVVHPTYTLSVPGTTGLP